MKNYEVVLPIAGVCYTTIEVDDNASKDEIFEAATNEIISRPPHEMIESWDFYEKYNSGNVCHIETDQEWSFEEIG